VCARVRQSKRERERVCAAVGVDVAAARERERQRERECRCSNRRCCSLVCTCSDVITFAPIHNLQNFEFCIGAKVTECLHAARQCCVQMFERWCVVVCGSEDVDLQMS